jgi:uncharacterized protein (DUF302 family)
MSNKLLYSHLSSPFTYQAPHPKRGVLKILVKAIIYLLALLGLASLGGLGFLYFHGEQMARSFDDEFVGFFGKFVEQVLLKKNVASAMIIKTQLQSQVTVEQAINAMLNNAEQQDLKLIANYSLHQEIKEVTGKPFRLIEVFHFCQAATAPVLLNFNPDLAAHLPYRIVLYQDTNGQFWLATLNLGLLIHGTHDVDPYVKKRVSQVQDSLLKVMSAGAHGIN